MEAVLTGNILFFLAVVINLQYCWFNSRDPHIHPIWDYFACIYKHVQYMYIYSMLGVCL